MMLYVLRHGIAEDAAPGQDDASRQLTPRGRTRLRMAARGMKSVGLVIDALLTSPLPRAAETAAILAEAYGGAPIPQPLDALAPGVSPTETIRALRPYARQEHVVIVGHEPGLSGLVALLLTGSTQGLPLILKKGGLVGLEVRLGSPRTGAALRWLLTPRQLRRLGR